MRLAAPRHFVSIGNKSLAELGAVDNGLLVRDDGDAALVAALTELLDAVDGTSTTTDDDHYPCPWRHLSTTLAARSNTRLALKLLRVGSDVEIIALHLKLEAEQAVESRSILDFTVLGVETSTVPRANDTTISGKHTVGEGSAVVSALGRSSVKLTPNVGDENLDGVVTFTGEGELLHLALSNIFGATDANTLFRHFQDG